MQQSPSVSGTHPPTEPLRCSAKSCRQAASYAVVWNNPKVHTPEREKTWLACEQHREWLSQFLDKRGFLLRIEELDERPAQQ